MWEETGEAKYRAIAENFWEIAAAQHTYVIGGQGDHEHWGPPGVVAGALSNYTCEGCVTYNMLKLTRLLHFHDPARVDLLDYYERGLFNQMLGTQDPDSPHGLVCYYTGLSAGAFKQQPMNYFPQGNPDVYATDYDTFTCDNATGLETPAKFADTIYTRDMRGVYVNLFIPSEVRCAAQGLTLRQTTGFPDDPVVRLSVIHGTAPMILRVRVPSWTAGPPGVTLNGVPLPAAVVPSASAAVTTGRTSGVAAASAGAAGGWVVVSRHWHPGDYLQVTLPMRLAFTAAPDDPAVTAATYGPVVLSGLYGTSYATADATATAAAASSAAATAAPASATAAPASATAAPASATAAPASATAAPSSGATATLSSGAPATSGASATSAVSGTSGASATSAASGPPATPPLSGDDGIPPLPVLDTASIWRTTAQPMTFEATADGQRITMVPVARAQHEHYTVYWQTT